MSKLAYYTRTFNLGISVFLLAVFSQKPVENQAKFSKISLMARSALPRNGTAIRDAAGPSLAVPLMSDGHMCKGVRCL